MQTLAELVLLARRRRKIFADLQNWPTPITAYHSVNVEEDAHEAGFDAYFPKPLDTGRIIESLGDLLKD